MSVFSSAGIVKRLQKDPGMDAIFEAIPEGGVFSFNPFPKKKEDELATYNAVVSAQATFERAILDSRDIERAVIVITTPRPCNPISYTVVPRTETVSDLLMAGATVACVYQDINKFGLPSVPAGVKSKEEYENAERRYNNFRKDSPNLLDFPIHDVKNELNGPMSGASYLLKTTNWQEVFLSLQSFQVQTVGQVRTWALWSGRSSGREANPAVEDRKNYVNTFLHHYIGSDLNMLMNWSPTELLTRDKVGSPYTQPDGSSPAPR